MFERLSRRGFAAGFIALSAGVIVPADAQTRSLYLSDRYSETADPAADLQRAVQMAEGRHILLDVGGEWCVWCRMLDHAIGTNPAINSAFAASFLIVKVNFSRTHQNAEFLSAYPRVPGYPHFFVLDAQGRFVESQPTDVFEQGRGYNPEKLIAFAQHWAAR